MRRLSLYAALAVLSTRPLAAETILYATEASQQKVDAYRVADSGLLAQQPFHQVVTRGAHPRRLVARGCNLYVATKNRTEVYRIHAGGTLELIGTTRVDHPVKFGSETQAHDIELSPDGRSLYVPVRRRGAIATYPLDEQGRPSFDVIDDGGVPAGSPASCVYGAAGSDWEDIEVANGRLYATYTNRVVVYGIGPDGSLIGTDMVPKIKKDGTVDEDDLICPSYTTTPGTPPNEVCVGKGEDRPDENCAFSYRGHINGGVGLLVNGSSLFVGQRFTHVVQGFTLDDTGNFEPYGANPAQPTKKEKKQERKSRKQNRTDDVIRYIGLTWLQVPGSDPFLYGAGPEGRTDAYRLRSDGTLPKQPTSTTDLDRASTPVRGAIAQNASGRSMLYVAGGESNRIHVYRLFPEGEIDAESHTATEPIENSYPNDVVPVDITSCD